MACRTRMGGRENNNNFATDDIFGELTKSVKLIFEGENKSIVGILYI